MNENLALVNGHWVPAQEEPYYPNLYEKIMHTLGKHFFYQAEDCVMCGKKK
jgi:hypothetical protein